MTSRGVARPPLMKRMTSGSPSSSTRLPASSSVNRRSSNRSVSRKTCIAQSFRELRRFSTHDEPRRTQVAVVDHEVDECHWIYVALVHLLCRNVALPVDADPLLSFRRPHHRLVQRQIPLDAATLFGIDVHEDTHWATMRDRTDSTEDTPSAA